MEFIDLEVIVDWKKTLTSIDADEDGTKNILLDIISKMGRLKIDDVKSTKLEKALASLTLKDNKDISSLASKCISGLKQRMLKFNRVNGDFGNPQRINTRKLLYELLVGFAEEFKIVESLIEEDNVEDEITKLTEGIELGLFTLYKTEIKDEQYRGYLNKAKQIYSHLSNNKELRTNLFSGAIPPENFASLSETELPSKEILDKKSKIQEQDFNSRRTDWEKKRQETSGQEGFYTCYKCRTKKTVYFQLQTRRADEGMTTFVNCLNCNNKWKC